MEDYESAKRSPGSVFKSPQDILDRDDLSKEQKIEVLKNWAYDEHEKQVADEENMAATEETRLLEDIVDALHTLGVNLSDDASPTK